MNDIKYIRVTIDIPEDHIEELKFFARKDNIDLDRQIRKAIGCYLQLKNEVFKGKKIIREDDPVTKKLTIIGGF